MEEITLADDIIIQISKSIGKIGQWVWMTIAEFEVLQNIRLRAICSQICMYTHTYTTFSLFICPSKGTWFASIFWLL
jgi:hypothetical protein